MRQHKATRLSGTLLDIIPLPPCNSRIDELSPYLKCQATFDSWLERACRPEVLQEFMQAMND